MCLALDPPELDKELEKPESAVGPSAVRASLMNVAFITPFPYTNL